MDDIFGFSASFVAIFRDIRFKTKPMDLTRGMFENAFPERESNAGKQVKSVYVGPEQIPEHFLSLPPNFRLALSLVWMTLVTAVTEEKLISL